MNLKVTSVDLIEWISTGRMAGVVVGMAKAQVQGILGNPFGWVDSTKDRTSPDFIKADIWGYGRWSLYFNEDALDAVTFGFEKIDEPDHPACIEGRGFNGEEYFDQVVSRLTSSGVEFFDLPKEYFVEIPLHSEPIRKIRSRANRTLLVGDRLLGRMLFDREDDRLIYMCYPFSPVFQAVGLSAVTKRPGRVLRECAGQ